MFHFQLSGSGRMHLCCLGGRWAGHALGGVLCSLFVWLIPGGSLWAPCPPVPLPGLGGRLHGDGSARLLLRLLLAQLRGQGCPAGRVPREVREFLALCSASSLAPPARTLLVLFLPTMGGRFAAALNCIGSGTEVCVSAVLGSVSPFS